MKKNLLAGVLLFFSLMITGCDTTQPLDPTVAADTKPVTIGIDEEKWISQGIDNPDDPRTINASIYTLSTTSRLLIRLSSFIGSANEILDEQPILLRVESADVKGSTDSAQLRACPITKNWMMRATWSRAYPYKNGEWNNPGGDIDFTDCAKPLAANDPALKNQEEKDFCSVDGAVCFNLNDYFKTFVESRKTDYGIAIVVDGEGSPAIYGRSTLRGPILFWRKFKPQGVLQSDNTL